MSKCFRIRPEFLSLWGEDATTNTVVTFEQVDRLSDEWEKPICELLNQLEEIDTDMTGFRAFRKNVIINDSLYTVFCIPERDNNDERTLSMYVQPADGTYPMEFMFSLPEKQQTIKEAIALAEHDATLNIDIYGRSWI